MNNENRWKTNGHEGEWILLDPNGRVLAQLENGPWEVGHEQIVRADLFTLCNGQHKLECIGYYASMKAAKAAVDAALLAGAA